MEVIDKKTIKAKSFAISSIMKDKKLSDAVFSGMESPIGSTKRKKAKAILKSINGSATNFNRSYDGMGGGFWSNIGDFVSNNFSRNSRQVQPPSGPQTNMPSGPQTDMMSGPQTNMPSGPQSNVQPGIEGPMSQMERPTTFVKGVDELMAKRNENKQIQQGAEARKTLKEVKNAIDSAQALSKQSLRDLGSGVLKAGLWGSTKSAAGLKALTNPTINYTKGLFQGENAIPEKKPNWNLYSDIMGNYEKNKLEKNKIAGEEVKDKVTLTSPDGEVKTIVNTNSDTANKLLEGGWEIGDTGKTPMLSSKVLDSIQSDQTEDVIDGDNIPKLTKESEQPAPESSISDGTGDSANYGVGDIIDIDENYGEDGVNMWYDGKDSSLQDFYRPMMEAYNSGGTAESFATQMMANTDELAEWLDLPKEVVDTLPNGGLLASHLIDLRESIRDEANLEEQMNNLRDLKTRGYTFKDDLENYVQGQDEYLGRINELQHDTEKMVAYMDTSNPEVAKRMENYTKYLNILEGRQNQRYTDFINESIDDYNTEYQIALDEYEFKSTEAQQKYNDQAAITQESYLQMKDMIKGLFNNIDARADRQNTIENWELDRDYKVARNAEIGLDISGYDVSVSDIVDSTDYSESDYSNFEEIMYGVDDTGKVDRTNMTSYDPYQFMQDAVAQDPKINPQAALTYYVAQHTQRMQSAASNGNVYDELSKNASTLSALNEMGANATDTDQINQIADLSKKLTYSLWSSTMNGIKEFISSTNTGIAENIKSAMSYLVRKDSKRKNADKSKYINNNSEGLGDIAEVLYDYYEKQKSGGMSGKDIFSLVNENGEIGEYFGNLSDSDLANGLSNELTNYLLDN